MTHEELEIEIAPDGKVTVHTKGIKGPRCLEVAEVIARVVGREESRNLTSEYYESPVEVGSQVQIQNRYQ
jgi:hypothetical protein